MKERVFCYKIHFKPRTPMEELCFMSGIGFNKKKKNGNVYCNRMLVVAMKWRNAALLDTQLLLFLFINMGDVKKGCKYL